MRHLITILIILFSSLIIFAQQFIFGKTLSPVAVKKKWGQMEFNAEKFRNSEYEVKAKMAFEIMRDKKIRGMDIDEVKSIFGEPEGYYRSDIYPAYIIQSAKTRSEETWQIVFLLNEKYKVRDVVVHKNCCYQ